MILAMFGPIAAIAALVGTRMSVRTGSATAGSPLWSGDLRAENVIQTHRTSKDAAFIAMLCGHLQT